MTQPRWQKYLKASGWNRDRALAIYTWNSRLAAAILRDLGHFEVALRNSYDRELRRHPDLHGIDWLTRRGTRTLFPTPPGIEPGSREDTNRIPRSKISRATSTGNLSKGAPRGKTIAELEFGFWTYLTDSRHEKLLWVGGLHRVFPEGTSRAAQHAQLVALRELRNRAAHHESVFDHDPEGKRRQIVGAARRLSGELSAYIQQTSDLPEIIALRP